MTTGNRKTGDFCWFNILTPNVPAAREFFSALLDWEFGDIPGMGYRVEVNGTGVGGLFDVAAPNTPAGMRPQTGIMIKVDSADEAGQKAVALGGQAMPAFDIAQQGRMAVCHDPNGAQFDVWEPRNSQGMSVDNRVHGAPSWIESMTSDEERARHFYSELFGWTAGLMPMPMFNYTHFELDGAGVAGLYPIQPDMPDAKPRWDVYFTVKNTDAALSLAVKLGGDVCVGAQDIPGTGRFGGITSAQGVMFYVIQYV